MKYLRLFELNRDPLVERISRVEYDEFIGRTHREPSVFDRDEVEYIFKSFDVNRRIVGNDVDQYFINNKGISNIIELFFKKSAIRISKYDDDWGIEGVVELKDKLT